MFFKLLLWDIISISFRKQFPQSVLQFTLKSSFECHFNTLFLISFILRVYRVPLFSIVKSHLNSDLQTFWITRAWTFNLNFDLNMCCQTRFWKVLCTLILHTPLQFEFTLSFTMIFLISLSISISKGTYNIDLNIPFNFDFIFPFNIRNSNFLVRVTLTLIYLSWPC